MQGEQQDHRDQQRIGRGGAEGERSHQFRRVLQQADDPAGRPAALRRQLAHPPFPQGQQRGLRQGKEKTGPGEYHHDCARNDLHSRHPLLVSKTGPPQKEKARWPNSKKGRAGRGALL